MEFETRLVLTNSDSTTVTPKIVLLKENMILIGRQRSTVSVFITSSHACACLLIKRRFVFDRLKLLLPLLIINHWQADVVLRSENKLLSISRKHAVILKRLGPYILRTMQSSIHHANIFFVHFITRT